VTQDEIDKLERNMELASSTIRKSIGGKPGESSEKLYGQAFAALVRAGLRQPLRKKYR
jgi:hypothetical protein